MVNTQTHTETAFLTGYISSARQLCTVLASTSKDSVQERDCSFNLAIMSTEADILYDAHLLPSSMTLLCEVEKDVRPLTPDFVTCLMFEYTIAYM